jgi:tetratricopeptide (TPR) repeat protein
MNQRIKQLKKLLEEEPNDPFIHYALSLELYKNKEINDAITKLENVIKKFPNYLPSYYQLAQWKFDLKNNTEALKIIEKGIIVAENQKNYKTLRELKELKNRILFEDD